MSLLEVEGLAKHYSLGRRSLSSSKEIVYAVDGVSFSIKKGETLGLVGESGCGKSTLARAVLRLEESTAGKILFAGRDISNTNGEGLRKLRKDMQIVFQDPFSSLNPRLTVGAIICEPLSNYRVGTREEQRRRAQELLGAVGLNPKYINRYPHEFSGGERQRIAIARALALNPKLIVCDEPVSSLDVSIQAQILNLLDELKREFGLSYLFISHDLAVVKYISDRVAVMYLGKILEVLDTGELCKKAKHPYTLSLLSAVLIADPSKRNKNNAVAEGEPPSPTNPPSGCRFNTRCLYKKEECVRVEPVLLDTADGHRVACHLM